MYTISKQHGSQLQYRYIGLEQGYSKCGPLSRIRTAKGFPVDRQGPPVSANNEKKQGPWTPEVLEIWLCGPRNKKFEYPWPRAKTL